MPAFNLGHAGNYGWDKFNIFCNKYPFGFFIDMIYRLPGFYMGKSIFQETIDKFNFLSLYLFIIPLAWHFQT